MEHALWVARKNYLCSLIKKVSDAWGGDDVEWLRGYCLDVIKEYPGEEIERAICCFTDLLKNVPRRTSKKG